MGQEPFRAAPAGDPSAAPVQCLQHGDRHLSTEPGFGGWEVVSCQKCHRIIARRQKEEP